jgi:hypothetical protein
LGIEPWQVDLERAFPNAEHTGPLTAKNLPDQTMAMPGFPHDLLDGHAGCRLFQNRGVGILAPEVALVPERSAALSRAGCGS